MNSATQNENYSFGEDWLLNTYCYIKTYEPGQEGIIQSAFKLAREYENKLSRTVPSSEIVTGNFSDETQELIDRALRFEEASGGKFCIHLGAVSALWDFSGSPNVPAKAEIDKALEAQSLDLGAIAKGYITDKVAEYLRAQNVKAGIISFGGNIYCLGEKADKTMWQVGIEKPFSGNEQALETREQIGSLNVGPDKSVVTSGIYERCFTDDEDNFYHHILDASSGYPCESDIVSATIVGPSSCDCDALATIAVLLGSEKAGSFLDQYDCSYVLVTDELQTIYSSTADFSEAK